jgi:putative DNA primase/helicase
VTTRHERELLRDAASRARGRGIWRRGPCPLCSRKCSDTALAVHASGYIRCFRCEARTRLQGVTSSRSAPQQADNTNRRHWALRLIERSTPIGDGDPVDRYLRGRGLRPRGKAWAADLRAALIRHPTGGKWPAMLGVVRDATGRIVGCHRTYLDGEQGTKASVEPCRLSLGPICGGAVRLGAFAEAIIVAEGIETALAASTLLPGAGVPWACLSASGLAGLSVPTWVRRVIVAADHDEVGEQAARQLCTRLRRREFLDVQLARPRTPGADMNDVLIGGVR